MKKFTPIEAFHLENNLKFGNESYLRANMGKLMQKTVVKCLLVLWVFSSLTYFIIFRSVTSRDADVSVLPQEKATPKSFSSKSAVISMPVNDRWSCQKLKHEAETPHSVFFEKRNKDNTGKTSYCLRMIESFSRCIGFVSNDEEPNHLLPNPFLAYDTLEKFNESLDKYRSSHIYFVHVMKSSGTSIEGVLKKLRSYKLGDDAIVFKPVLAYYCSNMLQFYHLAQSNPNVRYISLDKRSYGLHKMVPNPGYYVTILRDPVDRFVSMYYYIKLNRYPAVLGDQLFKDVFDSQDLSDFLERTKNKQIPFFDNHAVRMFHFDAYPDVFSTFSGGPDTYIPDVTRVVAVNESHFEEALKNLRSCAFVGLTEEFEKSQKLLELMLGLASAKEVSMNVNKGYQKKSLTEAQRALIEPRIQYDQKLYNEAKSIFDAQYDRFTKLSL